MTISSHTALGQEKLLNRMGDIQVNNPHVTLYLSYFVAFLPSTMMDQLAPVILLVRHMNFI